MPMIAPTNTLLTEPAYFILLSLSPAPKHGYAIMKDVRELSERRVLLSTGTLYGALKRLLDQGMIIRIAEPGSQCPGRERKVYKLTEHGRQVLREEVERLQSLLTVAERRVVEEHT